MSETFIPGYSPGILLYLIDGGESVWSFLEDLATLFEDVVGEKYAVQVIVFVLDV